MKSTQSESSLTSKRHKQSLTKLLRSSPPRSLLLVSLLTLVGMSASSATTTAFATPKMYQPHLADHAPMPPQKWMERRDGVAKRTKRICRLVTSDKVVQTTGSFQFCWLRLPTLLTQMEMELSTKWQMANALPMVIPARTQTT